MDEKFFSAQMARLSNLFGKRFFPDDKIGMIWKEMRYMKPDDFRLLVDDFVADGKSAPNRNDFRAARMARFGSDRVNSPEDMAKEEAHKKQWAVEEEAKNRLYARSVEKFGKQAIDQFMVDYIKAFMPLGGNFPFKADIFNKRALFHLAHNRGDMAQSIADAKQGLFLGGMN
jgi:hypothetical protein